MSQPVSILHEQFIKKLDILSKIDKNRTHPIYNAYLLLSSSYVIDHALAQDVETKRLISENFSDILTSECITEQIESLAQELFKSAPLYFSPLIHDYNQIGEMTTQIRTESDVCPDCGIEYQIRIKTSDMICQKCGETIKITGTQCEFAEISKNSPYRPSKHCENWIRRIYGMEKNKIPQEIKDQIRDCMQRDKVKIPSCELIREYLKEFNASKYNNNVVKIRREITGLGPPTPTSVQYNNICRKFCIQDEMYMKIKHDSSKSRRYYPCLIQRAIEDEYESQPNVRDLIISGIHTQFSETTQAHDEIYYEMCQVSNGQLTFRPTRTVD